MEPFLGSHEKSDKAEVMEASAPLATLQGPPKNSVSKIKSLLMQLKKKIRAIFKNRASLIAQLVQNLPAIRETWVQSLGWEDPLEKGKATHSSILAWRIPWTI